VFKAGAIYGEAQLNTKHWDNGLKRIHGGATSLKSMLLKLAVFAGVTIGIKSLLDRASEFKKEMNNVNTLLDETKISTQALTRELLQLDPALGSATELTKGLYQAFSAGAPTAKAAMEMTVDAAKLAKAGLMGVFPAVDILSTAINAYGRETMTTQKASDLFFQTIKYGKITGEQLSATIGDSITLFATAGLSLEELSAGVAALTKVGVPAAETTTQLNGIVRSFLKPSDELSDRLRSIGFESGSAFLKAKGLAGVLELVSEASKGDSAEMAKLIPEIRGLRGIMGLSVQGGREYKMILDEMGNATGVTNKAFEKQRSAMEELRAVGTNLQIVIGNIGKHFLDKVARGATEATRSLIGFIMSSEGMNVVAQIAGYVAGGFNVLKEALRPIWETIGPALAGVWETFTQNLDQVFGKSKDGAGAFKLLALAVNLVVSGIIVLGKAVSLTINVIGNLITAIVESGRVVTGYWKVLTKKMTWEELQGHAEKATEAFANLGKEFVVDIKDLYKTVRDEVRNFSGETETLAVKLQTTFETSFGDASNYIKINWQDIITGQKSFVEALAEGMEGTNITYKDSGEEMVNDTEKFTWDLKNKWKEYFDTVMGGFEYIYQGFSSISSEYYDSEISKLESANAVELQALKERFDSGLIEEEFYNKEKTRIETENAKKLNDLKKKQFESQKKNDILGVRMNAASSIAGWWAAAPKLGPIAGLIFAITMTAATLAMAGAQSAMISKREFVPAFAEGGKASGLSRINEQGGELIRLPDNTLVIPHDISEEIAQSVDNASQINVSFAGAQISDKMDLDYVADVVGRRLATQLRLRLA
jgi:TP901 family phage tail tape measure protein